MRRYDLVAQTLDPQVIADKRTGERTMSGDPTDSVTSHDGAWQFTVYAFGATSPFVHVLNLNDSTSFCVDLPAAPRDGALDLLWGLAASPDGRFVYAANAANVAVVEMPVDAAYQIRSGSLAVPTPASAAAWTLWGPITAEAKRIAYGAGAISPDDRTLYSLGELGVSVIDTATLSVRRSLAATEPVISLTLSSVAGGSTPPLRTAPRRFCRSTHRTADGPPSRAAPNPSTFSMSAPERSTVRPTKSAPSMRMKMLISTANDLPGYQITEVLGEVFGLTVRSRNIGSQFGAGLKSLVGGELKGMTQNLHNSRQEVINRMVAEAEAKGGTAIVAMRFDTSEMGGTWTEICAYGTAVKAQPLAPPAATA